MNKWVCSNCGYSVTSTDLQDGDCPICQGHHTMKPEESAKDIEEYELELLREDIKSHGNDSLWYEIEKMDDVNLRLRLRFRFFKIGGIVPENKIKIDS